jgi:hypothetical protein
MRRLALLLAIALVAAVPVGASGLDEPDGEETAPGEEAVELRTEEAFFLCDDDYLVQNLADLEGRLATWGPDAPEQSVAEGAGCGSADSPLMQQTPGNLYDATWEGTFTGALDSMTLHLHNIYAGPARLGEPFQLKVRLFVNGRDQFGEDGADVAVTAVRSDTGLSELIELTISDIGLVAPTDETRRQRITLVVHGGTPRHTGPTVTDTTSAWVWGTTEVPAGITFNPEEPAEAEVSVDR